MLLALNGEKQFASRSAKGESGQGTAMLAKAMQSTNFKSCSDVPRQAGACCVRAISVCALIYEGKAHSATIIQAVVVLCSGVSSKRLIWLLPTGRRRATAESVANAIIHDISMSDSSDDDMTPLHKRPSSQHNQRKGVVGSKGRDFIRGKHQGLPHRGASPPCGVDADGGKERGQDRCLEAAPGSCACRC